MSEYSSQIPPIPFKSDGCSGGVSYFWKKIMGCPPPFESCCYEHDQLYHFGGNWIDRLYADKELFLCIWKKNYKVCAVIFFLMVRLFGNPWLPFGWKWGFGWGT